MFKDGRFWDCEVQFFEDKVIVAHVKCEESIPKALEVFPPRPLLFPPVSRFVSKLFEGMK